ncbi:MAG: hypothetical protein IJ094_01240 [Bacilli bacterium]|nr:hypothetical protein [Bacilli bacterium]
MNKIFILNNCDKYVKSIRKNFPNFKINLVSLDEIKKYEKNINVSKKSNLYNDYLRLYIAYTESGLVLDGNIEVKESLHNFFKNQVFFGFDTENTIATNIIWSKEKESVFIKSILNEIEKNPNENITNIFSNVLNKDLTKIYNSLVCIDNKIYIYPYDYFYPLDYEKHGKNISENTKIIFHKKDYLGKYTKVKYIVYKKFGQYSLRYLLTLTDSIRNKIGAKRYLSKQSKGKFENKELIQKFVIEACSILDSYKEKNLDYVIFHNPRWMGVTSATKELFENLVPLQGTYTSSQVDIIAKKIIESKVNQVIFSAFEFGFDNLARRIKELNKDIKIKLFWHSSNSQINGQLVDSMNWKTNLKVIKLHREGIIDVYGTCKESLVNFYKSQGFKTAFIKNTVRLDENLKKEVLAHKISLKNRKIKIGLYAAGMDWRKNMFNQIAGASLIDNAILDSVPLNFEGQVFASKIGIEMIGLDKGVKREELLKRMVSNDINLYVTFSECAPMLPIESMEVGTLCLTGNNHHYFMNTELEDYLVVSREDDVCCIKEKIKFALENKDKIFDLYSKWKIKYDKESKESVEAFLQM